MRRIAILNQKGGVGKTTTTVNLAAALARLGYRVLVLDMDPQAHATLHFGVDPTAVQHSMYELLTGRASLQEAVQTLDANLSLVSSHIDLAAAEVELVGVVGREVILRDLLKKELMATEDESGVALGSRTPLELQLDHSPAEPVDFLLMDCPPSLGILTLNALTAANEVLIPLQPHFLALHGMSKLLETIALVQQRINRELRVTGVVLCMVEANTRLAAEVESDLREFLERRRDSRLPWAEAVIFDTRVRRNIRLAECPSHGKTIFDYAPTSKTARGRPIRPARVRWPNGAGRRRRDVMSWPDKLRPETEAVLRWLECEEGVQDQISALVAAAVRDVHERPRRLELAAGAIRRWVAERNPLKNEVSLYSDLLRLALDRVEWIAVAEWLVPEDGDAGERADLA